MNGEEPLSGARDRWASGKGYEPYIGRWSRFVAREFLAWLSISAGSRWLDVGCGTGALSQTILQAASPGRVLGVDFSLSFVGYARAAIPADRAQFIVGDAQALPVETGVFDAVVSALALNFIPRPDRALAEMARAARLGGTVAVYVWDYANGMQLIRRFWEAAAALDPAAADLDEGRRFPLCQPGPLKKLFQGAGLHDVEARPIELSTLFRDFDDYWAPFLGGQGPAPGYVQSLAEDDRVALREHLRSLLPFSQDGSISLQARAWAVRGVC